MLEAWETNASDNFSVSNKGNNFNKSSSASDNEEVVVDKLAGENDIVGLNFGGERLVKVKRSLLLQFKGSLLAQLFSAPRAALLDRDDQGNIFLDYSASVMMPLIEFLRLNRDMDGLAPLPQIGHSRQSSEQIMKATKTKKLLICL